MPCLLLTAARRATSVYPRRAVTRCHTYDIAYRFHYTCATPACGHVYGRHSRSIDTEKLRCGRCGDGRLVLTEAPGGAAAVPGAASAAAAAAGGAGAGAGAGASGRAALGELSMSMSSHKPPRTPSAYNAFMAANRKAVAASLPAGTTPQQVMAAVARLWKEQKAAQAGDGAAAAGAAGGAGAGKGGRGSDVAALSVNLSSRLNIVELDSED